MKVGEPELKATEVTLTAKLIFETFQKYFTVAFKGITSKKQLKTNINKQIWTDIITTGFLNMRFD